MRILSLKILISNFISCKLTLEVYDKVDKKNVYSLASDFIKYLLKQTCSGFKCKNLTFSYHDCAETPRETWTWTSQT